MTLISNDNHVPLSDKYQAQIDARIDALRSQQAQARDSGDISAIMDIARTIAIYMSGSSNLTLNDQMQNQLQDILDSVHSIQKSLQSPLKLALSVLGAVTSAVGGFMSAGGIAKGFSTTKEALVAANAKACVVDPNFEAKLVDILTHKAFGNASQAATGASGVGSGIGGVLDSGAKATDSAGQADQTALNSEKDLANTRMNDSKSEAQANRDKINQLFNQLDQALQAMLAAGRTVSSGG